MPKQRVSRKFRFTRKRLSELPVNPSTATSNDQEYSDETPGLKFFVSKSGKRSYHYRYIFRKKRRIIKIADFDCVPLATVREIARKYRGMVNLNRDPATERDRLTSIPTFSEFSVTYIDWAKSHKRSWKDDANKLKTDLMVSTFGRKQMSSITSKNIQDYLDKIKNLTSFANSNRHRSLLSKMFSLCIQWEVISGKNPCSTVPKFPEDGGGRRRHLSSSEIKLFISALDEYRGSVSALLLKFLLYSGLRLGESKRLKWTDILQGKIHIRMGIAKSKKSRYVETNPLIESVIQDLKEVHIPGNPFLFPGRKPNSFLVIPNKLFRTVKKKIGLDCTIHSLRHTYATLSIQAGTDLYVVQAQLGHAHFSTTQKYAHVAPSLTARASWQCLEKSIKL